MWRHTGIRLAGLPLSRSFCFVSLLTSLNAVVTMSAVAPEGGFTHILRLLNTNVEGKRKVVYALCSIQGVGRRFATLVVKKAGVCPEKRAGELTVEEQDRLIDVIQNPVQYKIPNWFLNRRYDVVDGTDSHLITTGIANKMREDLDRLKRIYSHRGIRHYLGLKVRGQHTKTTSRRGRVMGVTRKK
ncbi:30S ribosomal protein S18e [Fonticula alba]|uniref:30S ribosomal protein S18e n=1 Tax=Fonticula alba TaxID=691883 RepID=A0A058Z9E6_FONAL|nr:30S ribosomal protein S18e [Fonticula alba]KCV70518.1 30S ribosomal protein S18e [Fonticula alba]|eukprot:XP_009495034.1 30S ribosomal protein S18e [Fonticula alba]